MNLSLREKAVNAKHAKNNRKAIRDEKIERIKQEILTETRDEVQRLVYRMTGYCARNPLYGQDVFCNGIKFSRGDDKALLKASVKCDVCKAQFSTRLSLSYSRDRVFSSIGEIIVKAERCRH